VHRLFQFFHRAGSFGDGAGNLIGGGGQFLRHGLRAGNGPGARFLLRQFLGDQAVLRDVVSLLSYLRSPLHGRCCGAFLRSKTVHGEAVGYCRRAVGVCF
jgi:hypothetical protein